MGSKQPSLELEGLRVVIDRVLYHYEPENLPEGKPHVFIYFITINNMSDRKITLLARKWIIESDDQDIEVIEGDKIVGETPTLASGESFSYNSYHIADCNCRAHGAFHGRDEFNNLIFTRIPVFEMKIPDEGDEEGKD